MKRTMAVRRGALEARARAALSMAGDARIRMDSIGTRARSDHGVARTGWPFSQLHPATALIAREGGGQRFGFTRGKAEDRLSEKRVGAREQAVRRGSVPASSFRALDSPSSISTILD